MSADTVSMLLELISRWDERSESEQVNFPFYRR